MKRINIFRPGTHTDSSGQTISFSEDHIKGAVAAYDPDVHEAPIVIGHPQDNLPAYGWVNSLSYSDDRGIDANPHQVNKDFEEMIKQGAFKKVSASFYSPESPNNPSPGNYYLRHVGFLGAQPPAIKGLRATEFSEEENCIEFEEDFAESWVLKTLFRNVREFVINKYSKSEADDILPEYLLESLEDRDSKKTDSLPEFKENDEVDPVTKEELEARQAEIAKKEADIAAKEVSFSERETAIAEKEKADKRKAIEGKVDGLIKAGKALPANKDALVSFVESLGTDAVLEFEEAGEGKKLSGHDFFFNFMESQKPSVDFGERSGGDDSSESQPVTPNEVSIKALAYQEEQRSKGIDVTATQAVKHVIKST